MNSNLNSIDETLEVPYPESTRRHAQPCSVDVALRSSPSSPSSRVGNVGSAVTSCWTRCLCAGVVAYTAAGTRMLRGSESRRVSNSVTFVQAVAHSCRVLVLQQREGGDIWACCIRARVWDKVRFKRCPPVFFPGRRTAACYVASSP